MFANKLLQRIESGLQRLSRLKFVLAVLGFALINNIVFSLLTVFFDDFNIKFSTPPIQVERSAANLLFSVAIVAPLVETFAFQYLCYFFLRKVAIFRQKPQYILIISAALFGLAHHYHLIYLVGSFLGGIIYMLAYMSRVDKDKNTFWLVALIHSLYNAILAGLFLLFETQTFSPLLD